MSRLSSGPRLPVFNEPEEPPPFAVGARVRLHGANFGAAGRVLRIEHGKVAVLWTDLDFISRHRPETLAEVSDAQADG